VAAAGANYVAIALQRVEDELQGYFADVGAVAMPHRRQDVEHMDALLCIYRSTGQQQPIVNGPLNRHVFIVQTEPSQTYLIAA